MTPVTRVLTIAAVCYALIALVVARLLIWGV